MRLTLPTLFLLSASFANNVQSADKRVLPGPLVRRIDKTNAGKLWRLILTSMQPVHEVGDRVERTEDELENLVRELTDQRLVLPTRVADDLLG